jgi:hypothetical protein
MAIQQDIKELLIINQDIKKQKTILLIRRILMFIIIGFFIEKDVEKNLPKIKKGRNPQENNGLF